MPIIGILAVALIISLAIAAIVAAGAALLAVAAIGGVGFGIYKLIEYQVKQARAIEQQQLEDQARTAETLRLTDLTKTEIIGEKDFLLRIAKGMHAVYPDTPNLPCAYYVMQEFLLLAKDIYNREVPPPPPALATSASTPQQETAFQTALREHLAIAQTFDPALLAEAILKSYLAFAQALPRFSQAQLTIPIAEVVDFNYLSKQLIDPFRDQRLWAAGRCRYVWEEYEKNAVKAGGGDAPVYPQDFKGNLSKSKVADLYLRNTAFHQLFHLEIPFGFEDETRCTHHWCLGHNGTGKTTYLRYFLKADLERVERGECSLVVIDSKKLIREMRTLKQFATTLRDRIIIVDPVHPVALNPFHLPKEQSVDVLTYMLGNLTEASDLQKGALSYLMRAARTYDKPNLYVLRDFFLLNKKRGHVELPDGFERFDSNTQFWFRNTFPGLHNATKDGVQQRLMNILDHPMLEQMLNADRCALDLFDVLHEGGKVLLVDTDRATLTPERTEVLGRLFIALIDQLSSRRTHLDEKKLKPIFVYLDEAHDYIKSDERFADILEKARAQRIAITVAHHHEGQIDPRIEASLKNAGLKSHCDDIKSVSVKTRRRNYTIPISQLDFDEQPQMTLKEYGDMRQRIVDIYGVRAVPSPIPPPDDISEPITKNY
jgi:hypothetical protein